MIARRLVGMGMVAALAVAGCDTDGGEDGDDAAMTTIGPATTSTEAASEAIADDPAADGLIRLQDLPAGWAEASRPVEFPPGEPACDSLRAAEEADRELRITGHHGNAGEGKRIDQVIEVYPDSGAVFDVVDAWRQFARDCLTAAIAASTGAALAEIDVNRVEGPYPDELSVTFDVNAGSGGRGGVTVVQVGRALVRFSFTWPGPPFDDPLTGELVTTSVERLEPEFSGA